MVVAEEAGISECWRLCRLVGGEGVITVIATMPTITGEGEAMPFGKHKI